MENTFKGYTVEEIMDNAQNNLKAVTEEYIGSKLDGMLNTENALVIDDNTTIYFTKGLYKGIVGGRHMEDVRFVIVSGRSVSVYED